jgi:hypothetical protein
MEAGMGDRKKGCRATAVVFSGLGQLVTLAVAGCLLLQAPLAATVIRVPEDYNTIQEGIDAASDGDTVLVADGVYTGPGNRDLDFGGGAILLTSEHGPEETVIDCEREGRGLYFHSGEGPGSVVRGLAIRGGKAPLIGGGILCISSSPTIEECIIVGNEAEHGSGIFTGYGSPLIRRNWIEENLSTGG